MRYSFAPNARSTREFHYRYNIIKSSPSRGHSTALRNRGLEKSNASSLSPLSSLASSLRQELQPMTQSSSAEWTSLDKTNDKQFMFSFHKFQQLPWFSNFSKFRETAFQQLPQFSNFSKFSENQISASSAVQQFQQIQQKKHFSKIRGSAISANQQKANFSNFRSSAISANSAKTKFQQLPWFSNFSKSAKNKFQQLPQFTNFSKFSEN